MYYEFRRDGDRTWLEQVDVDYVGKPNEIPTPKVDLADAVKLWSCQVDDCTGIFRTAGLAAKHFNSKHMELKEGQYSWKEHTEVMHAS
jgi:hypothetical protein